MNFTQSLYQSKMFGRVLGFSGLLMVNPLSLPSALAANQPQVAATTATSNNSAPAAAPTLPDVRNFELAWPDPSKPNAKRHAGKKSSGKSKTAKKREPEPKEKVEDAAALNARATNELTIEEKNRRMGIGVSTGTVNLSVDQVESPYKNPAFQLGLALQPYRPVGLNRVEGLSPYDTSTLGSQPMGAIEFRYMPFQGYGIAGSDLGFIASIGYAQYQLDLTTPTGTAISDARLQTIISEIEFANRYQFRRAPHLFFLQGLGVGRLDSIQSANSTLANGSSNLTFLAATLQAEYQFAARWSVTGGYEFREKVASSSSDLGIQNHNFMLGFLGSFR